MREHAHPLPDPTDSRAHLQAAGFALWPGVMGAGRIMQLRHLVEQHFERAGRARLGGKLQSRALDHVRGLLQATLTPELAAVMAAHVAGTPLLTGDCTVTMNTRAGWRRDALTGAAMDTAALSDPDFAVFRLAIFLQDQTGKGLQLRPGSHLDVQGNDIAPSRVPMAAGDVIVLDTRLDHADHPPAAGMVALRCLSKPAGPLLRRDADDVLTGWRSASRGARQNRIALFLTFGTDNRWTRAYERAGRDRHGPPAVIDGHTSNLLDGLGLDIIQPDQGAAGSNS
ncbi:hypothetical protein [Paracoccus sp. R86501]|uniref:hypothetical protein n=1 Tax=Paracoccus sp. R86501 TaxID=3101711 RepID=UPI00366EB2AF